MNRKSKHQKGRASKPFAEASQFTPNAITELVRHLARISAENDYKKLTETSNVSYDAPNEKGLKNE